MNMSPINWQYRVVGVLSSHIVDLPGKVDLASGALNPKIWGSRRRVNKVGWNIVGAL